MQATLAHRGPDDAGLYTTGGVGLAHTRLSIIDPGAPGQPIWNEDQSVAVVFNGEIYNYRQLREDLEASGHRFQTATDTEVLVHLYEERGRSFVDALDGMFAFAIWDATAEKLLLGRDPMGIKPLLLADDGETIGFASELPALLEAPIAHGGIDTHAIAQYFSLGYIPAPRTAFQNVSKLRPGHLAVISADGLKTSQFYTPTISSCGDDIGTASTEIADLVRNAVSKRLMSDVPLGAFLSGGIDSSIIVGVMSELQDRPVKTFTVGFEQERFDESGPARAVAEHFETDHHEFAMTPADLREDIPTVLGKLGEPFADPSLIPTHAVARETGQHVKVALSGDGGDELFAGYEKYRGELFSRYYRALPRPLRSLLRGVVTSLPGNRDDALREAIRQVRTFLVAGGTSDIAERHFRWNRVVEEPIFVGEENSQVAGRSLFAEHHDSARDRLSDECQDPVSVIQAVDTRGALADQILRKVDAASMYKSLEVRTPLLDTGIVEYAQSLQRSHVITPRTQKRVLKRAFTDLLPKKIRARKKQGFDMPLGHWFRTGLADDFRMTVSRTSAPMIDQRSVLAAFDRHRKGRRAHGKFLWTIYVFCKWYDRMQSDGILD
jgi:asparagine synthase (glutamine-hydrolysing)